MLKKVCVLLLPLLLLSGCFKEDYTSLESKPIPWVLTREVVQDERAEVRLSGSVKARYESPIAFQLNGRILAKHVVAGQRVNPDDPLFTLDPRDVDEVERSAMAQLSVADAALATARNELKRQQQLLEQNYISRQALERFELAEREALSQRESARAVLAQARNTRTYTELSAEHAGVLINVEVEAGQVVAAGQVLATLAQEGDKEIEVYLPDGQSPPQMGHIDLRDGQSIPVELREIAGAADSSSRSWRARYRLLESNESLLLGSVVQVTLFKSNNAIEVLRVPLAALDERGHGAQVWQVIEGQVQPVSVDVLELTSEYARIRADLNAQSRVIALGTHLLTPGMQVRERAL